MKKLRQKTKVVSLKLLITILLGTVVMFNSGCSKKAGVAGGGGAGAFSMPPMPVEVSEAKVQMVADQFEAVGTIEAIEAITVVSEIDAIVTKLPFQEGSYIRRGALIAQLDDSQLAAEVARTEALFEQSKSTYERVKNIVDQKAGTMQDLDDAGAALKVASANLELAKARYNKTRILAPFDGIIGSRRVSVGSFLRPGQPITEFANIDEIRINFSAPERFLSQLRRGAEVTVAAAAYPDYKVKGKILVIEPVIDPATRNVRVVARVSNPSKKLLPGMSANLTAVLTERPEALTIPNEAVFATGDQSFVFVVNTDSTVSRVPVKLGLQMADVVEVVQGLEPGKQIVLAGHQKLSDRAKVMPIDQGRMQEAERQSVIGN